MCYPMSLMNIFTKKQLKGAPVQTLLVPSTMEQKVRLIAPQSTEVFYLNDGEQEIGPIEKVYVTTLVTPMGLASSFNGGILKIIAKK